MINKNNKDKTLTRLVVVQALYIYDISESEAELALTNIENYYAVNNPLEEYTKNSEECIKVFDKSFLKKIFIQTIDNIKHIDIQITNLITKQQEMSQLSSVLRAILRAGTCELLFFPTPYKVVIDEFVTLTREFYTDKEISFTNSILDKVANSTLKHE